MINKPFYIIVAVDQENGIGKDNQIPWHFSKEIGFFKEQTTKTNDPAKKNMVFMGRTTWESIPKKFRPLKNRKNIVLTHNPEYQAPGATVCHSLEQALKNADDDEIEKVFNIGGARVFGETINSPELTGLYITRVKNSYDCDTFFPEIPKHFSSITKLGEDEENGVRFEYLLYERE